MEIRDDSYELLARRTVSVAKPRTASFIIVSFTPECIHASSTLKFSTDGLGQYLTVDCEVLFDCCGCAQSHFLIERVGSECAVKNFNDPVIAVRSWRLRRLSFGWLSRKDDCNSEWNKGCK